MSNRLAHDRQLDRLVLFASSAKCLVAPRVPDHRVVSALPQVRRTEKTAYVLTQRREIPRFKVGGQ
jgi:hypothetical protein